MAGIAPEDVDADQRARAKAVNFGILYGSSAPRDEVDALCALATKLMRGASGGLLSVQLEVDVGVGENWREAH